MKQKVQEYEYDEAMEPSYRKSMFKSFNKTLEEGFFPMIVVDAVNHRVRKVAGRLAFFHFILLFFCFGRSITSISTGVMPR